MSKKVLIWVGVVILALVIAVGDVEVHLLYAYGSLLAQTQMIQELHHLPPAYGAGV